MKPPIWTMSKEGIRRHRSKSLAELIVCLRESAPKMTYKEIGELVGVTGGRIREIYRRYYWDKVSLSKQLALIKRVNTRCSRCGHPREPWPADRTTYGVDKDG